LPLSTRDTVVLLTLARAATSAMVIGTLAPQLRPVDCPGVSEPVSGPVSAVNRSEGGHVNVPSDLFRSRDGNRLQ
jgi:hypothetical protein